MEYLSICLSACPTYIHINIFIWNISKIGLRFVLTFIFQLYLNYVVNYSEYIPINMNVVLSIVILDIKYKVKLKNYLQYAYCRRLT